MMELQWDAWNALLAAYQLIADSVNICNAHKADAMVCISIVIKLPRMLIAAMRLNIPAFCLRRSHGASGHNGRKLDLIDAMVMGADTTVSDEELAAISLLHVQAVFLFRDVTANSMNCLTKHWVLRFLAMVRCQHTNRMNLLSKLPKNCLK